jgi:septin family protein
MCPPFLIINATHPVFQKDKCFLGRTFQWGICNIEDKENSDFILLHRLLLFYFADSTIELTDTFAEDYVQKTRTNSTGALSFFTGLALTAAFFGLATTFKR